jgi:hypothetical protein
MARFGSYARKDVVIAVERKFAAAPRLTLRYTCLAMTQHIKRRTLNDLWRRPRG